MSRVVDKVVGRKIRLKMYFYNKTKVINISCWAGLKIEIIAPNLYC